MNNRNCAMSCCISNDGTHTHIKNPFVSSNESKHHFPLLTKEVFRVYTEEKAMYDDYNDRNNQILSNDTLDSIHEEKDELESNWSIDELAAIIPVHIDEPTSDYDNIDYLDSHERSLLDYDTKQAEGFFNRPLIAPSPAILQAQLPRSFQVSSSPITSAMLCTPRNRRTRPNFRTNNDNIGSSPMFWSQPPLSRIRDGVKGHIGYSPGLSPVTIVRSDGKKYQTRKLFRVEDEVSPLPLQVSQSPKVITSSTERTEYLSHVKKIERLSLTSTNNSNHSSTSRRLFQDLLNTDKGDNDLTTENIRESPKAPSLPTICIENVSDESHDSETEEGVESCAPSPIHINSTEQMQKSENSNYRSSATHQNPSYYNDSKNCSINSVTEEQRQEDRIHWQDLLAQKARLSTLIKCKSSSPEPCTALSSSITSRQSSLSEEPTQTEIRCSSSVRSKLYSPGVAVETPKNISKTIVNETFTSMISSKKNIELTNRIAEMKQWLTPRLRHNTVDNHLSLKAYCSPHSSSVLSRGVIRGEREYCNHAYSRCNVTCIKALRASNNFFVCRDQCSIDSSKPRGGIAGEPIRPEGAVQVRCFLRRKSKPMLSTVKVMQHAQQRLRFASSSPMQNY